ncbi:hypothetical protein L6303_07365 [archaeon]|nr:hypothetical protein [Nanoarchaeota archaeon]MBU4300950.1 hypothetical protein [Nanoarchaeota archaeon]MBU4452263.1 hypothetical protein [Nanoarchaeota archaeon]MCG2724534.1 hypothetical protein [archaeon]
MQITKRTLLILVMGLLIVFAFPKDTSTCASKRLCFGYTTMETQRFTWLVVENSSLENHYAKFKNCRGFELALSQRKTGCPIPEAPYDGRLVECENIIYRCTQDGSNLVKGVKCSEWQRACQEIIVKDVIPINIENKSQTGIQSNYPR